MQNIITDNLAEIKKLMLDYQVESAYAFGSVVTGKTHKDSDVDFVIRFATGLNMDTYADNYFDLMYALQDLLKKEVDLVAEETLKNPYLIESINESKMLIL